MTIHTITAIYNHPEADKAYANCYCYDEPQLDLVAEPLVHDATEAIISSLCLSGKFKNDTIPTKIKLHFTDDADEADEFLEDDVVVELEYLEQENDFSMYDFTVISPEYAAVNAALAGHYVLFPAVPLCPHLMDYFEEPPRSLFVRIEPVNVTEVALTAPAIG